MLNRTGLKTTLISCSMFLMLNLGVTNTAQASPNLADQILEQTSNKIYGKVTEVIQGAGYTYAEVDTGNGKVWAAASISQIKTGDMISFSTDMAMENFHSKSLNRDFPVIYFVNKFETGNSGSAGASAASVSPHGNLAPTAQTKAIEGIDKVEGGNTIAEVHSDKQKLNGKLVRVRGKVTKYTANVMGKNWLHIRDSSTLDDLTVTTGDVADLEDIVVIEGKLSLDKDFGYGYVYPVIVEGASLKKE